MKPTLFELVCCVLLICYLCVKNLKCSNGMLWLKLWDLFSRVHCSFSHVAHSVWNYLPHEIRHIQSPTAFKTALKTDLFKTYYCWESNTHSPKLLFQLTDVCVRYVHVVCVCVCACVLCVCVLFVIWIACSHCCYIFHSMSQHGCSNLTRLQLIFILRNSTTKTIHSPSLVLEF